MAATSSTPRVLVVDTDSGFTRVLGKRLDAAGWEHRVVATPPPAHELVAMKLNALVLDPTVLGAARWELLERVGSMLPELALVVCTQGASVEQRVRGLRLGADDWLAKPCHPEEVVARIEAILRRRRRSSIPADVGPRVAGELEIRPDQFQAFVSGRSLNLTRREYELLAALADETGRVLEREDLYQRVWGYAMAHGDRSVDVFVRKLRAKLRKASPGWAYIHTHFGIGYRFEPQLEAREPASGGVELAQETVDAGRDVVANAADRR